MKVLIVYYSMYGHVHKLAQAIKQGVEQVEGAEPVLRRVPETLSDDTLKNMGALEIKEKFSNIPEATVDDLEYADAVIFGTPAIFGNMCIQMKQFIYQTGQIWQKGALIGKAGSVFVSSNSQHGGQESTILSFHHTLFGHGMVVAGLPYSFKGQMGAKEVNGGTPYGASTIAGEEGKRMPSETELQGARFQGKYVAELGIKLST
ncbi:MAG: NAD(P)H:quinone oxidoreductase [Elusimicrobiota bacterium]